MKSKYGSLLLTLVLVAVSGAGGAWIGARLLQPQINTHTEFHDRLFSELRLSDDQQKLMDALEAQYATENRAHRERLAAANLALADAIEREDAYGVEVEHAVDNVHAAMLDLQKSTIRHLYEMRDILNTDQKAIFDRYVAKTLRDYAN